MFLLFGSGKRYNRIKVEIQNNRIINLNLIVSLGTGIQIRGTGTGTGTYRMNTGTKGYNRIKVDDRGGFLSLMGAQPVPKIV